MSPLAAAAVAALLAAGCGQVGAGQRLAGSQPAGAATGLARSVLAGDGLQVRLEHPVAWRLQRPPGPWPSVGLLGYLANYPLRAPCQRVGVSGVECAPGAVGPEPPGGVELAVSVSGATGQLRGGLRSDRAGCAAVAGDAGRQLVLATSLGRVVVVGGCFRAPGTRAAERAFARLAASVVVCPAADRPRRG